MSLIAFVLIVISAGLHASWNLVAKKNHITIPFYAVICTSAMLFWIHVQFWTPIRLFDISWQFWLYMLLSVLFDILAEPCWRNGDYSLGLCYHVHRISS